MCVWFSLSRLSFGGIFLLSTVDQITASRPLFHSPFDLGWLLILAGILRSALLVNFHSIDAAPPLSHLAFLRARSLCCVVLITPPLKFDNSWLAVLEKFKYSRRSFANSWLLLLLNSVIAVSVFQNASFLCNCFSMPIIMVCYHLSWQNLSMRTCVTSENSIGIKTLRRKSGSIIYILKCAGQ